MLSDTRRGYSKDIALDSIDINSGTVDQLKTLVGIGETYARKIVEGRPYQTIEELLSRNILPQQSYDRMKEFIATKPR